MKPIFPKPESIHDGLDRQNLTKIRKRFLAINQDRLTRMRDALTVRQQLVLDAIPLLFHTNHPMMPGFESRDTPAGVCHFKITKGAVQLGRGIARSFTASQDAVHEPQITAIFVMGSVGTIAQSESSDLDFWLCFKPGLTREQLELLNRKCEKITQWALQCRLEVHFFLMDNAAFKRGQLSALNEESSGSAQRLLLLDEFYRTAIHLAGRTPIWWFVPPSNEHEYDEYTDILQQRRFLNSEDVLDFGGIPTIPDSEFLGASRWQLYKGIESPYKSVLKLLLLESYADQYPNIQPLSLVFKEMVYAGEHDIDQLDSYVMIYRHIERYLQEKNAVRRLELARRCFYFKVNYPLTRSNPNRDKTWQHRLLESLTEEWGWQRKDLLKLDQRNQWKAPAVHEERSLLKNELSHGFQVLKLFAERYSVEHDISAEEWSILGRKLQAAFETRPGKITWINPGISSDLTEQLVTFAQSAVERPGNIWSALIHPDGTLTQNPIHIKTSASLVELYLWCYCNQIVNLTTRYELQQAPHIEEGTLHRLLKVFANWLPLPLKSLDHNVFKRSAEPVDALFLLNVGSVAQAGLEQRGIKRLSSQTDALHYSGFGENLIISVDLVLRNSWNELTTRRFDSSTALLDSLQDYLKLSLPGSHHRPPKLQVECVSPNHANTIATRTRDWLNEIIHCYYGGEYMSATRYVFEMAGLFHILQFKGPRLITRQYPSLDAVIDALGDAQPSISPIYLDSHALVRHPLKAMCRAISSEGGGRSWAGAIHIFFQRAQDHTDVYVVDEHGSLVHRFYRNSQAVFVLKTLHYFFRSVIDRQTQLNQQLLHDFGIFPIHFYELKRDSRQCYVSEPKRVANELVVPVELELRAIGYDRGDQKLRFNFYCGDQFFSCDELEEQIYLVVAQQVLSRRKSREDYPLYLTDLDLTKCAHLVAPDARLTTSHYMKVKNRLETTLNRAIGILVKR